MTAQEYDPDTRQGQTNIELTGKHRAEELAILDCVDGEVIQDDELLIYLAQRDFDLWPIEGPGSRPTRDEISGREEIQSIFIEGFCNGYKNHLDQLDPSGDVRQYSWRRRTALRAIDDPKVRQMRFPDFTSDDAALFSPDAAGGIENIKKHSRNSGSALANMHRPEAVIEDEQELRALAGRQFDKWWNALRNTEAVASEFSEIRRIFIGGFSAGYTEFLDICRQNDEHDAAKARDEAKAQEEDRRRIKRALASFEEGTAQADQDEVRVEEDTAITITDRDDHSNGVVYKVEFIDPDRMTQAVSFSIRVKDDGLVELEEA